MHFNSGIVLEAHRLHLVRLLHIPLHESLDEKVFLIEREAWWFSLGPKVILQQGILQTYRWVLSSCKPIHSQWYLQQVPKLFDSLCSQNHLRLWNCRRCLDYWLLWLYRWTYAKECVQPSASRRCMGYLLLWLLIFSRNERVCDDGSLRKCPLWSWYECTRNSRTQLNLDQLLGYEKLSKLTLLWTCHLDRFNLCFKKSLPMRSKASRYWSWEESNLYRDGWIRCCASHVSTSSDPPAWGHTSTWWPFWVHNLPWS